MAANLRPCAAWGSGGYHLDGGLSGDGYSEFTVVDTTSLRMAGVGTGDSNQTYQDIEYAWYLYSTGRYVYEAGTWRAGSGAYAVGDVLRVAVEGGIVKYYQSGGLKYTSAVAPVYPLRFDTSLNTPGAQVRNARLAGSGLGGAPGGKPRLCTTAPALAPHSDPR